MSFDTFLGWAVAIIGLAGIAGGALAVLMSTRRTKIDEINERQRQDLLVRVKYLEEEAERSKTKEQECEKRIADQQGQIHTLTELVTQAAAVSELKTTTKIQHEEVVERLEGLRAAIVYAKGSG